MIHGEALFPASDNLDVTLRDRDTGETVTRHMTDEYMIVTMGSYSFGGVMVDEADGSLLVTINRKIPEPEPDVADNPGAKVYAALRKANNYYFQADEAQRQQDDAEALADREDRARALARRLDAAEHVVCSDKKLTNKKPRSFTYTLAVARAAEGLDPWSSRIINETGE